MFTANTMAVCNEAIGVSLLGTVSAPAVSVGIEEGIKLNRRKLEVAGAGPQKRPIWQAPPVPRHHVRTAHCLPCSLQSRPGTRATTSPRTSRSARAIA
jgi:hypothetical protein